MTLLRTAVEQLRGTLVATQWRGDTALTLTLVVLAAAHGLLGLLISHLASVDVKQNVYLLT